MGAIRLNGSLRRNTMRLETFALVGSCLLFTPGCHSRYTLARPPVPKALQASKTNDKDLKDLLTALRKKEEGNPPVPITQAERNQFIFRVVATIDEGYQEYVENIETTRGLTSFLAETTSTTLSGVATILGSASTKSILSAASALTTSTELSSEKNFFQKQTTTALVNQMDALRLAALTPIKLGTVLPTDQYTVEQAIVDLKSYLYAGTLARGLSAIEAQSAVQLKQQQNISQQRIALSPISGDFGQVALTPNPPPSRHVVVTNSSSTTLNINTPTVAGAGFSLTSETCTAHSLTPGQTCEIIVIDCAPCKSR